MKNHLVIVLVLLSFLIVFSDCGGNDDPCLISLYALTTIEPSSNPVGYEIRISGEGFTENTLVRFDNVDSPKTTLLDPSTLIATVPSGVLGPVELSVSDGGCLDRNDRFEVYADFPANIPFSPNTIIIPQPISAVNYPDNFLQNCWENINDREHCIFLVESEEGNGILNEDTTNDVCEERHSDQTSFFSGNPISGHFRTDDVNETVDIEITIDRSAKPGGEVETYTGELIEPASVGSNGQYVLLLTSQKDGRQLLFEFPN